MQVADRNRAQRSIAILAVICAVLELALAPNVALGLGRANFALVFAVGTVLAAAINLLVSRMFANLILAIVKYDQSFLGLKRTDKNAEEAGE